MIANIVIAYICLFTSPAAMSEGRADRFGTSFSAAQFSQCLSCVHWEGDGHCKAFDDTEVPIEIRTNQFDHREPHPDDNGRTYTPEDDDAGHPMDQMQPTRPT